MTFDKVPYLTKEYCCNPYVTRCKDCARSKSGRDCINEPIVNAVKAKKANIVITVLLLALSFSCSLHSYDPAPIPEPSPIPGIELGLDITFRSPSYIGKTFVYIMHKGQEYILRTSFLFCINQNPGSRELNVDIFADKEASIVKLEEHNYKIVPTIDGERLYIVLKKNDYEGIAEIWMDAIPGKPFQVCMPCSPIQQI